MTIAIKPRKHLLIDKAAKENPALSDKELAQIAGAHVGYIRARKSRAKAKAAR